MFLLSVTGSAQRTGFQREVPSSEQAQYLLQAS